VLILIAALIATIILEINKEKISLENEQRSDPIAVTITPSKYIFFLPNLSEIFPIGRRTATTVIVDTSEIHAAEDKSNEKSLEILGRAIPIMLASMTAVKRPKAIEKKDTHFCFWVILISQTIKCSQEEGPGKELLYSLKQHMTGKKLYY